MAILFCMKWIHDYQLFLFDFDGLLVNTEELHYKAYQNMCRNRGFSLDWDWRTYSGAAMYESTGLKEAIYKTFPELYQKEPKWEVLYQEKKRAYVELLQSGAVQLMPGVETILKALQEANITRCVVTHSPLDQVSIIRQTQPLLNTIPFWVTREHYSQPKPSPECYQKAIAMYAKPGDRVIGFEDSPRGLKALLGSHAKGIFISSLFNHDEIQPLMDRPFTHFPSMIQMCKGL